MCKCMYISVTKYIYIHLYIYLHTCPHTYICSYIYIYISYTYTYIYIYKHKYIWVPFWSDVILIWYHYTVICTFVTIFNWWLSSKDMKLRVLIKETLVVFHWLTFCIKHKYIYIYIWEHKQCATRLNVERWHKSIIWKRLKKHHFCDACCSWTSSADKLFL